MNAATAEHATLPSRILASYDDGLVIVTFDPAHRDEFRRLNIAWLTRYFRVEPIDERVLGNPETEILAPGGEILFALIDGAVVGTVALKAETDGAFELTKMAVESLCARIQVATAITDSRVVRPSVSVMIAESGTPRRIT